MKTIAKMSLLYVALTFSVLGIACDGDSPTAPDGDMSDTNFTAEESFSFESGITTQTRLRVQGINGGITITGSPDTNAVSTTGVRRVGSDSVADAQTNLARLEVRVTSLTDEILVETIQPEQTGGRNYNVDYTITIPQGLNVSVTHVNGNVALNEIVGNATVELTNGPIDGQVTLPRDGTIDLSTTNGNIDLRIPQSTNAEFSANVTNGSISTSDLVLANQVSSGNSLQGTLGDGRGTISLRTVNGNISVTGF